MRNVRVRFMSGILAVMLLLSGCSAAITKKNNVKAVKPTSIDETHYAENTLHKVSVTDSNRPFVVNGKTDYKIIVGQDEETVEAVNYLVEYVNMATGAKLTYAKPEQYSADGKFIVFDVPELFQTAGLSMPKDDLRQTGYYIKSVNDNLFLAINDGKGARWAMLSFLKNVLGYKMYSIENVVFDKDGTTLPDMDIVERPDFDLSIRIHHKTDSPAETYMMGFDPLVGHMMNVVPDKTSYTHTALMFLPMEDYQKDHPKWYSTENNDLCYTAHGDEKERQLMAQAIADKAIKAIDANPDCDNIKFSPPDHQLICKCEACVASNEKYEGADSAAYIQVAKKVNNIIQAELQKRADATGKKKRNINLYLSAYNAMEKPPVRKNADGTYSPIDDTVTFSEGMALDFAPIFAHYTYSFYHEKNVETYENAKKWASICNNVYYFLYDVNFLNYLYPQNTWDATLETRRFVYNNGARTICMEQTNVAEHSTAFTDLNDWIFSVTGFDLNLNYDDLLDEYFKDNYLAAAGPMRQYFDELRSWSRYQEETYNIPPVSGMSLYRKIANVEYWPYALLTHWEDLINEAYEAAEVYKEDQPVYKALVERIKIESIFVKYALLDLHPGMYSDAILLEKQLAFKADCEEIGISHKSEGRKASDKIESIWEKWRIAD